MPKNVAVELYECELISENDLGRETYIEGLKMQIAAAQDLKLSSQVALLEEALYRAEKTELKADPILSEDWDIWCIWLPRAYYREVGKESEEKFQFRIRKPDGEEALSLSSYRFDTLDLRVLNRLQQAEASGLFDGFEIRTPEESLRKEDPILLGVQLKEEEISRYLLARWGPEGFLSLSEIKGKIIEQAKELRVKLEERACRIRGTIICSKCEKPILPFQSRVEMRWRSDGIDSFRKRWIGLGPTRQHRLSIVHGHCVEGYEMPQVNDGDLLSQAIVIHKLARGVV